MIIRLLFQPIPPNPIFDPSEAWSWFGALQGLFGGFYSFLLGIALAVVVFLILVGLLWKARG